MMSMLEPRSKHVCYRCRRASATEKPLIACNYCPLFWHVECLIQPESSIKLEDWKCPRHQERSHTRKYKKKKASNGEPVKVIQEEDDVTFQEAEDIVKYGGVIHTISSGLIESQFLDYARRSRLFKRKRDDDGIYDADENRSEDEDEDEVDNGDDDCGDYDSNDSFCMTATKQEAEEWLECIACLQFDNQKPNGVQMLLDAANQYNTDDTNLLMIASTNDNPLKTKGY